MTKKTKKTTTKQAAPTAAIPVTPRLAPHQPRVEELEDEDSIPPTDATSPHHEDEDEDLLEHLAAEAEAEVNTEEAAAVEEDEGIDFPARQWGPVSPETILKLARAETRPSPTKAIVTAMEELTTAVMSPAVTPLRNLLNTGSVVNQAVVKEGDVLITIVKLTVATLLANGKPLQDWLDTYIAYQEQLESAQVTRLDPRRQLAFHVEIPVIRFLQTRMQIPLRDMRAAVDNQKAETALMAYIVEHRAKVASVTTNKVATVIAKIAFNKEIVFLTDAMELLRTDMYSAILLNNFDQSITGKECLQIFMQSLPRQINLEFLHQLAEAKRDGEAFRDEEDYKSLFKDFERAYQWFLQRGAELQRVVDRGYLPSYMSVVMRATPDRTQFKELLDFVSTAKVTAQPPEPKKAKAATIIKAADAIKTPAAKSGREPFAMRNPELQCFNCRGIGHVAKMCQQPCKFCEKPHNSFFCNKNPKVIERRDDRGDRDGNQKRQKTA